MRVALWAFVVGVAYWPGIASAAYVPRWAAIGIGVPLVSRMDFRCVDPLIGWLLLIGVMLAAASLAMSPDRLGGCLDLIFLVMLCGVFVAASSFESLDAAMTGCVLALGISAVLCIAQMFGWSDIAQTAVPGGLFLNRDVLAMFAAPVFVWCALRRLPWLAVIAAVPLVLCQSRAAWLSAAIGLVFAWRPTRAWLKWGLVFVVGVVAIGSLVAFGGYKIGTAGQRIVLWGATGMAITPFGNGLGWFKAAHPIEQYAHSDVLQALVEIGVGAVALSSIPIVILMRGRGTHADRAAFVAMLVQCVISFPLHMPASGFLAAVLAGFLARRHGILCLGKSRGRDENGASVRSRAEVPDRICDAGRGSSGAVPTRS